MSVATACQARIHTLPKQSPCEATTTVCLPNGGREGYAYTRMGLELHFPLMLQPTTTIYALAFLEAGNAWTSVSQFNPFSLKRSAGAGVRIHLPRSA